MKIVKSYVTVLDNFGRRIELKFYNLPTQIDVQNAYDIVIKPIPPEPSSCPLNNPKCSLYKTGVVI